MSYPERTSSTLPVVSQNKMAEKGQSPAPAIADSTVIARDRDGEDGVSYVLRLLAPGGPTERGEGEAWSSASLLPRD